MKGAAHTEVYLDNNATTPVLPVAAEAAMHAMQRGYGNPSSSHATGIKAKAELERTRALARQLIGADTGDIERADPTLQPPRVPGHEVVGRIAALGEHTPSNWKVGQRVGVGRLGGHCGECVQCRQGRFQQGDPPLQPCDPGRGGGTVAGERSAPWFDG